MNKDNLRDIDCTPTKDDVRKAIERSGYVLEQRICPVIEKNNFIAFPNEQFEDQDEGKSREIDVRARRADFLQDPENTLDMFETNILIECKNNSIPFVFFTHTPFPLESERVQFYGYPIDAVRLEDPKLINTKKYIYLNKTYIAQYHHYYHSLPIASQFCKIVLGNKGKKTWSTSHEDIYEVVEKITKASMYYRSLPMNMMILENKRGVVNLGTIYPVLLFSGQIYQYSVDGTLEECDHLLLNWKVQSKKVVGNFYIDVMKESYLPTYLDMINDEHDNTVKYLIENIDVLRKNVYAKYRQSVKEAKSKGTYKLVKEVLPKSEPM